jgi:acyl-CoA thioester hydrolase
MNNMWYAGMFDQASWALLLQLGMPPSYFRDNARGMATVEQVTTFKHELLAGELVEVRSHVVEIREKVLRLMNTMVIAETGMEAASQAVTAVHIDLKARKSCPIPPALRVAVEQLASLKEAA